MHRLCLLNINEFSINRERWLEINLARTNLASEITSLKLWPILKQKTNRIIILAMVES